MTLVLGDHHKRVKTIDIMTMVLEVNNNKHTDLKQQTIEKSLNGDYVQRLSNNDR